MSAPMIFPIFVIVIGLQHIGFAALEMFFWNTPTGHKIFRTEPAFAEKSKALAANQGLYNLFLAGGLLVSFLLPEEAAHWFRFYFLGCVVIAGAYGAYTVSRKIFLYQAAPALFALFFLVLGR